jgi:hypothetical protein
MAASRDADKVVCRTPTPGKKPTRIDAAKFALVERAIRDVVPAGPPGLAFAELADRVHERLSEDELKRLGSLLWYVTTVKLEMEVRGELIRVPGVVPQRLVRVSG